MNNVLSALDASTSIALREAYEQIVQDSLKVKSRCIIINILNCLNASEYRQTI